MKENNTRNLIFKMTGVALFGALSYVMTAFASIPYAGGAGYFNFGDIINFVAAMTLGPIEGMCVGMIGGVLADFTAGYAVFAPWTLLAKGSSGLSTGLLFHLLKKKNVIKYVSPFVGALLGAAAYIPAYIILYGVESVAVSTPFDCIQTFGSAIISILIVMPLEKTGVLKRLLS